MTENKKKHQPEGQSPEDETPSPESAQAGGAESPADPEAMRAELEQVRAQADEYLDGWKRAQAELVNYRRRVERDSAEVKISAAGQAAARWFPVMDDFERALKERATAQNLAQWADGVDLIYRKGIAALEAEGISPIEPAAGTDFDPNLHEAVTREMCADREDGEILEVIHRGYRMGERVLRPAKVRVACKPESNSQ